MSTRNSFFTRTISRNIRNNDDISETNSVDGSTTATTDEVDIIEINNQDQDNLNESNANSDIESDSNIGDTQDYDFKQNKIPRFESNLDINSKSNDDDKNDPSDEGEVSRSSLKAKFY